MAVQPLREPPVRPPASIRLRHRLLNPVVVALARSPLHGLLDASVLLLTYTGRRSGKLHTIPVQYAVDGDDLVVLVGDAGRKVWWRSLRGGGEVTVRLGGRTRPGVARVVEGDAAAERALGVYLSRFPRVAKVTAAAGARAVLVVVSLDSAGESAGRA